MNKNIANIAKQANLPAWAIDDSTTINVAENIEKFAKLIAGRCIDIVEQYDYHQIVNQIMIEFNLDE